MVSFANSTLEKAELFEKKLRELEKTIPLIAFRTFIATGKLPKDLDPSIKEKMIELKDLRTSGISGEMRYILAQASSKGLTLNQDIVTGKSIIPKFSKSVLKAIPNLEVYQIFSPYSLDELAKLTEISNVSDKNKDNEEKNETLNNSDNDAR